MPTLLVFAIDVLVAAGAIEVIAWFARNILYPGASIGFVGTTVSATAATIAAALTAYLTGLHDRAIFTHPKQVVLRAGLAGLAAGVVGLAVPYLYFYEPIGRVTIGLQVITVAVAVGTWRLAYGSFIRRGPRIPLVVVGAGAAGQEFAEHINATPMTRYVVVGFVDDSDVGECWPPVLGPLAETVAICNQLGVGTVVVSNDDQLTAAHVDLLSELTGRGLRVTTVGAAFMTIAGRIALDTVGPRWMIDAFEQVDSLGRAKAKRLLDVAVASIGLVGLSVLVPFLYLAVKIDSHGPFFYRQPRIGLGGRVFNILKIRTMAVAERDEQRWASARDSRVTTVGRFLRRTRLDELPQFWNVLKGEMSVVGPRPEQPKLVDALQAENSCFRYRHLVKPGITGWAQIHQAYASSIDDSMTKLSYDLYYVRRYGLVVDLDIMMRTLFVMIARIGSR